MNSDVVVSNTAWHRAVDGIDSYILAIRSALRRALTCHGALGRWTLFKGACLDARLVDPRGMTDDDPKGSNVLAGDDVFVASLDMGPKLKVDHDR